MARTLPIAAIAVAFAVAFACHHGTFATAAPAGDAVPTLPSYGTPPTPLWSGFLNATEGHAGDMLHYVFAQSSRADHANAPVVLWLNGGPGSSSLLGMLEENGPLLVNADGGLTNNPYAWTSLANVLWLESPAGVGYSYCANSLEGKPCNNTDRTTAAAARAAVAAFFADGKFPELAKNAFYITGESYAGVYVPTLVEQIRQHARDVAAPRIKLRGMAIGNGIIGHNDSFPGGGLGVARIETMHRVRECHRARCPPTSSNRARCCGCSMALSARSCG